MKVACPFSKFKNALGIPGKGIHRFRLMNLAIVDYILAIVGAIITSFLTHVPLVLTTIIWLILGIVAHVLFGVPTDAVKFLGISC
jgi:hypothetical protein